MEDWCPMSTRMKLLICNPIKKYYCLRENELPERGSWQVQPLSDPSAVGDIAHMWWWAVVHNAWLGAYVWAFSGHDFCYAQNLLNGNSP